MGLCRSPRPEAPRSAASKDAPGASDVEPGACFETPRFARLLARGSGAGLSGVLMRASPSAPAGSSLLSTADQMAAATSSSLRSASMMTQRRARPRRFEERPPQGLMKGQPLRFEPVGGPRLPSLARPLEADFRIEVEDQGQIGPVRADRQALERGDELRRQIARRALISPGRIGEPVGNDPGSARERRQNRLVEMVDARGGEQHRLPRGAKSAREAGQIASRSASAPGDPPALGFEPQRPRPRRGAPRVVWPGPTCPRRRRLRV